MKPRGSGSGRVVRWAAWAAACGVVAAGLACDRTPTSKPAERVRVFVTIPPQAYFVERVGGPYVDVSVLVPPGQSHHTYEPTPRQMTELAGAQVFFRIGTAFEDSIIRQLHAMQPNLTIVDMRQNVPMLPMTESCADDDDHAHAHEYEADNANATAPADASKVEGENGAPDPHIWLDPVRVKIQAATICDALSRLSPHHAAEFRANLAQFTKDLDAVDAQIRTVLAPLRGREFFVYHPAYGYFGARYGLRQVAVEVGGKEPSARQLAELIRRAKAADVQLIFVQPQFVSNAARTVAEEIHGAVVPMDPLARDYLKNLRDMAEKIRGALGGPSSRTTPAE